jgi:hypothetical protein
MSKLADETTNISTTDQFSLYVRYLGGTEKFVNSFYN